MDDKKKIVELEDRLSRLEKQAKYSTAQTPLKLLAIVFGFFGAIAVMILLGALIGYL